ncbi:MAG: hypothetical protein M0P21_04280, partial [Methanoculleus sp.]|nr:hypothetical protein [Methanoculleus sp.]
LHDTCTPLIAITTPPFCHSIVSGKKAQGQNSYCNVWKRGLSKPSGWLAAYTTVMIRGVS